MVGILLATHADLGAEFIQTTNLLYGKVEGIEAVGLHHGDDIDALCEKIKAGIERLDTGDGVLVFVDLLGGSPSNMTLKAMMELHDAHEIRAIAGVNLPMLVESIVARTTEGLDRLVENALGVAGESVVDLGKKFGL